MADVKEILGLKAGGGASASAPKAKASGAVKKPDGVSREVFALTGGQPVEAPVVPSNLQGLKEKRKQKTKVSWQWRAFKNSGRPDELELSHWVKTKDKTGQMLATADYHFAKYNKKIQMLQYDDEEYNELLTGDPSWTREETDHLFELCQRFDLRFIVVADRYDWPGSSRTVEDLKERYYTIARKLLIAREGSEEAVANHPVIRDGFNVAHEVQRKKALEVVLSRSAAHEREEGEVLEEAARIEEVRAKEAEEMRKASGAASTTPRVDLSALPMDVLEGVGPSLFDPLGAPKKPEPGVYARGWHTKDMADRATRDLPGGQRIQKRVLAALEELGIKPPQVPTKAVCGMYLQLRRDLMELIELRKRVAASQNPGASPGAASPNADGAWGFSPGAVTKGGARPQPLGIPGGLGSPGDGGGGGDGGIGARMGKRDSNKRKAPARYDDGVPLGNTTPRGGDKRQRVKKQFDE